MPNPAKLLNKTNLLFALPLAVIALMEGVMGMDVPGVQLEENWVEALIGALGVVGFRDAIRKVLDTLAGN